MKNPNQPLSRCTTAAAASVADCTAVAPDTTASTALSPTAAAASDTPVSARDIIDTVSCAATWSSADGPLRARQPGALSALERAGMHLVVTISSRDGQAYSTLFLARYRLTAKELVVQFHPGAACETACAACCRAPCHPGMTACTRSVCLHLLPGRDLLCLVQPAECTTGVPAHTGAVACEADSKAAQQGGVCQ